MRHFHIFLLLASLGCLLGLSGCETTTNHASHVKVTTSTPIATIERIPESGVYRVKPGDTLYSIAWRYGFDYQALALRNHLAAPYEIMSGEIIYLRGEPRRAVTKKNIAVRHVTPSIKHAATIQKEPTQAPRVWKWPATGRVVGKFAGFNKGINIAGERNAPVFATTAGKVVYCGNGLRAYGNLIIIKHNAMYLSAYANNGRVLVRQGDFVAAGQKIAEMGRAGQDRFMLHFEIRRNGLPVNPLIYLVK